MALGERHSGDRFAINTGAVFAPVVVRERIARNGPPPDVRRDEDDTLSLESNLWPQEARRPQPAQLLFALAAAAICWVMPIAVVYWLAS
jgi:hypothetical protein